MRKTNCLTVEFQLIAVAFELTIWTETYSPIDLNVNMESDWLSEHFIHIGLKRTDTTMPSHTNRQTARSIQYGTSRDFFSTHIHKHNTQKTPALHSNTTLANYAKEHRFMLHARQEAITALNRRRSSMHEGCHTNTNTHTKTSNIPPNVYYITREIRLRSCEIFKAR